MPSFLTAIIAAVAVAGTGWPGKVDRIGAWSISEKTSLLTEAVTVVAYAQSGKDGRGPDGLSISCGPRRGLSVKYVHEPLLGSGWGLLTYRMDDDAPVTVRSLYADDGVHLADPGNFGSFIGRLGTAKRLRVQAKKADVYFDLASTDEMLAELRRRCLV